MSRVLIVEDEPQIRRILDQLFQLEGYDVRSVATAAEGYSALRQAEPDLVLLDILLPDGNGVDLCRRIRQVSAVPIIFVTAVAGSEEAVAGLQAGGDDYVTKPFNLSELAARAQAVLRRRALDQEPQRAGRVELDGGRFVLDSASRSVSVDGREITLTPREFAILDYLVVNAGRVVPHEELVNHVWGSNVPSRIEDLRTYVRLIRRKIEPNPSEPRYLLSRIGEGYSVPRTA